jgi:hypothetical protein
VTDVHKLHRQNFIISFTLNLVNSSETALTQLTDLLILIYDPLSIEGLSVDVVVEIATIEEVSAVSRLELKAIFSIE